MSATARLWQRAASTRPRRSRRPWRFKDTWLAMLVELLRARPNSVGLVIVVALATAIYFATTSPDRQHFDYFVRLADAFLHGRIHLIEAPSWLNELIPSGDGWYVAYPPMPAVVLVPFVATFGDQFPQQVASVLLGGISVGLVWLVLGRFTLPLNVRFLLTAVFGFGTVMWYVTEVGSAWLFAHVVALLFSLAAILLALHGRWPFAIGLFLGCAATARLPVGLSAPFFVAMIAGLGWPPRLPSLPADRIAAAVRVVTFGAGLAIPAVLYLAYNVARWGTPVDQGYVLIPGVLDDPIYAEHGILAIDYIPRHLYAIFLRSWNYVDQAPWLQPSQWGLGVFLTTPLLAWIIHARWRDPRVAWAAIGAGLALIPIVTHGNVGIQQFGYRFSLDVQPLLFVMLATAFERGMSRWAALAGVASIVICAYAIWAIAIGFTAY